MGKNEKNTVHPRNSRFSRTEDSKQGKATDNYVNDKKIKLNVCCADE